MEAADHKIDDLIAGQVGQRTRLEHGGTVPQDCDGIADLEDLLKLVTHEQHRAARVLQLADHAEQALGLVRGDGCGRLVEQQDAALDRQSLGDLDQLSLRD